MITEADLIGIKEIDMAIQKLFEDCLSFISITDFE